MKHYGKQVYLRPLNSVFLHILLIGGVPAKVLKYRFVIDDIFENQGILYP